MDFPQLLDVYQLSDRAYSDYAVSQSDNPNKSVKEENDAASTLSNMRAAFDSLGYGRVPFDTIADRWTELADTYGSTLIRDDVFVEYWQKRMVDRGLLSRESIYFLEGHVDWKKVAADKGAIKLTFAYCVPVPERTYWLIPTP